MTDERSGGDSGDDEQSEDSSDAEVINGTADDTAHDKQMRYSPSLFLDSTHVCGETDVNRPKEKGQPVMEGTQLRADPQTDTQATRQTSEQEQELWVTHFQDFVHSGARLRGVQSRREGFRSGVFE